MAGFGATNDPWSFAETGINLVSVGNDARTGSAAQCVDSNGDVVEETVYDTGASYEATYEVCPGKTAVFFDTSTDFRLGKVLSSKVITSIAVNRSNTDRLSITIGGENCPTADSNMPKFVPVFPSGYLVGGFGALAAGVTVSAGKVISSSVTNTVQVSKGLDSGGAQVCKNVYAGRAEATNELQSCDTAPAAAADTGWTLAPGAAVGESNTGYPTKTVAVFQNLERV